jgi:hypothetical protein
LISRLSRLQAVTQKFDEALRRCRKRACFDGGEDRTAAVMQSAIGQILGDDFLRQKGDA